MEATENATTSGSLESETKKKTHNTIQYISTSYSCSLLDTLSTQSSDVCLYMMPFSMRDGDN